MNIIRSILTAITLTLLLPNLTPALAGELHVGRVIETTPQDCPAVYDSAQLSFSDGSTDTVLLGASPFGQTIYSFCTGDQLIVERLDDGTLLYRDVYRLPGFAIMVAALVLLVLVISRGRGMRSVVALILSTGFIFTIVLPRIAAGESLLLWGGLTLIGVGTVSYVVAHGFKRNTFLALSAAMLTLVLAWMLSGIAMNLLNLTGSGSEYVYMALGNPALTGMNWRGLYLLSILLGALGVLDDITTAQVAVTAELRETGVTGSELYKRSMRVGHVHIASLMNTLVFAYAAVALPLLIYTYSMGTPLWYIFSTELVQEELTRMIVGSMALMLAVPLSTWLGVYALVDKDAHVCHNHSH